ncbi:MAG: ABC transporter permease [Clostridiales bacterium]|jgi:putative ABC transport system permease protein|nr:ABC transporter permease [Clostridiales bacterium]
MLTKKMLRDIRRQAGQFVSVFLMSFLAVFFFSGIAGESAGLEKMSNDYYVRTNFADAWIYSRSGFTAGDMEAVLSVPEIKDAERRLSIETTAETAGNPQIVLYFAENHDISRFYLLDGRDYDENADGIWLDDRFAEASGMVLGDEITLKYNGFGITKNIIGLIYSPEYVYMSGEAITPDFALKGFAYISNKQFPLPEITYTEMLIKTDAEDFVLLEEKVGAALKGEYSVFLTRDNFESYAQLKMEILQHKSMAVIFPPVFLVITLLTLLTTMARLINGQRTQLGTLKALGFSRRKITLHYIGYGFWLTLFGSLLGVILGPIVIPPLFYPSMSAFYTLPVWKPTYHWAFYLVAAGVTALNVLISYIACRAVLKEMPSEALRPKAPKAVKERAADKKSLLSGLGFNLQWNVRDMSRNKTRTVMAVIGALGCTALLVCAFGMNEDMNDLKVWQYEEINRYESKIMLDEQITDNQLENILALSNGQAVLENAIEIRSGKGKLTGGITVTDGGLLQYTDNNRNPIKLADGVNISFKIAKRLGVGIGDTVYWHIFTEEGWKECRIAGIYRSPAGQGLAVNRAVFESFGYEFKPTAVISESNLSGATAEGISGVLLNSELTAGWDEMTEAMLLMVAILIFAAVILAAVVLYNLGLLSFIERGRELATLKVIGFKSGELTGLLLVQNLVLSFIGFLAGIPCGILLVQSMIATMGEAFDMIAALHFTDVLLSFVIVFVIAVCVNLMFSGRLRRLDMVSSLKSAD